MIIKIARPNPVPVRVEGNEITKPKFRPEASWLTIECTRFKHHMIPRDQYDPEGALPGSLVIPDEVILAVGTIKSIDGKPDEPIYDELCVLEVEAPEPRVVIFDTVAYVCNDAGQTMERIQPQKKFIGQPVKRTDKGDGHLKKAVECLRCGSELTDGICEPCKNAFESEAAEDEG